MSKTIAFVPARKGSVGLPGKNMAQLAGKPLVGHAIDAAIAAKGIDEVVVSSDDPRVLEYAGSHGARPIERPARYATSDATMTEVLLDWMVTDERVAREAAFCLLQPTSPLRTGKHVEGALKEYWKRNADLLLSVSEVDRSLLKCFFRTDEGEVGPVSPRFSPFSNRQTLPHLFKPNGAIYICSVQAFLAAQGFPSSNITLYEMSRETSLDIDSQSDLLRAQDLIGEENG